MLKANQWFFINLKILKILILQKKKKENEITMVFSVEIAVPLNNVPWYSLMKSVYHCTTSWDLKSYKRYLTFMSIHLTF